MPTITFSVHCTSMRSAVQAPDAHGLPGREGRWALLVFETSLKFESFPGDFRARDRARRRGATPPSTTSRGVAHNGLLAGPAGDTFTASHTERRLSRHELG